ncbi:acetoacetyl-CoA synthetase isoform X2 [Parasteatoda tepidariorum]|uniref:acetoacetyl-CoA synthetase isoform X2 n=1 Tax=Parasteatoda tepidariorum TaxID=114398 RepID=UPI0039BCFA7F
MSLARKETNMVKSQDMGKNKLETIWNTKIPDAELEKFKDVIQRKYKINFGSYWDFHSWSVKNFETFWHEVWQYFQIISSSPYKKVFAKNGPGFLDNIWFEGATMNYAENLLKFRDDRIAINYVDTDGNKESITFSELYKQVSLYAAAFKKNGLKKGDRVASYMSNRKESVIAMLAAVSIGAIWGGAHPLYGAKAASKIMERMQPKFLIAVDRFPWDEEHYILNYLPAIAKGIQSLEKVIIVPTKPETLEKDLTFIQNSCLLDEFLMTGKSLEGHIPDVEFEQVSANHPVFICFTSGTTGTPKGVLHSGKVLLSMLVSLSLHCNLKRGDAIFSHYAVGWILWNFYVNCLALGMRLVLHEGYPLKTEDGYNYWDKVAESEAAAVTVVPSLLERMEQLKNFPSSSSNFEKLKLIKIGGSTVKMENIQYLLTHISKDVLAASVFGSTESCGYITAIDWNLPSYGTEAQVPTLGMDLHCFNSNGVWCQNDECWINPKTRGITFHGRSDDTITQNGERFLPNDIYFAIQDMEELEDYLCVPQKRDDDDRAVLFLKLKCGQIFTAGLKRKVTSKIREELWMDIVPKVIIPVTDIPYNVNGKKMESIVKKIISTNIIPDISNIRNPECLPQYCDIPEILSYSEN